MGFQLGRGNKTGRGGREQKGLQINNGGEGAVVNAKCKSGHPYKKKHLPPSKPSLPTTSRSGGEQRLQGTHTVRITQRKASPASLLP